MRLRRAALAVYRASLWLYPRSFRARFGEEMAALYEDLLEEQARRGRAAAAGGWLRALCAGLAGAARAWLTIDARRGSESGRGRRGDKMLTTLASDVSKAVRGLIRNPAFAVVAVLSLGLGMAANATMFTLVRALVWSRLPVPEAERLVRVFETDSRGASNVSYPDYRDLREQAGDVFDGLLVHDLASFGLRVGDGTEVIHGELVSENYFDVLRLTPAAGRLFSEADSQAQAGTQPVVLSHHLWRSRFGGEPAAIGRVIELSGQPVRIAGIAPPSFNGTKLGLGMDVWVPLRAWARAQGWRPLEASRGNRWLNAIARLRPGTTIADAQTAVSLVAARLATRYPDSNRKRGFAVMTQSAGNFGGHGPQLIATIGGTAVGAAILVLLVACGNVAALLLARASSRRREMAVRRAIGASRGRLLGHFLAESLVIAGCATLVGLLLGRVLSPLALMALPPLPYRFALALEPDSSVVAWMAAAGLLTALACAVLPAVRSAGQAAASSLLDGHGAPSRGRLPALRALSVLTLSFCCVALVLAGLFARSLAAVRALDPGFETSGRATASVDVSLAGKDAPSPARYCQTLIEQLAGSAPSRAAAVASNLPLTDRQSTRDVFDAARPPQPDDPGIEAWYASVSESYFDVLGQPLLAGRAFGEADRRGPLVAIVSRRLAEQLWPGADAVGRRIRLGRSDVEVVGVAADAKYESIAESPRAALYVPFWTAPSERLELVVRGRAGDSTLPQRLVAAAQASDPRVPVFGAKPLEVHLDGSLWMFRLAAGLAAGTGLLAAVLALAGLHGLMSYAARQSVREIGLRMALGASRGRIARQQLGRAGRLAALGVTLGLLVAAAGAGLVRTLIVDAPGHPLGSPYDPLTFLGVGGLVMGLGILACLPPALAAARTDPARSLRADEA